ncbi:MAG: TadE/TadG family type IV pilus assembly protein [Xanthobacteraceae bacterium]
MGSVAAPLLRRFIRQNRATTSVEFALLATPFLALTLGIIQTAIVFFAGQTLETAAASAGRLIMTGQAQTQGWSAAQFKQQVCNQVQGMFNCGNGLYIDVETYSSFASVNLALPVSNGTLNTANMGYNPGAPGEVVVVRLYYQYPVYFNVIGLNNLNGGLNLLAATAVFQNEPYASS